MKDSGRRQTPDPALRSIADARHRLLRAPGLGGLALVLAYFLHP